MQLNLRLNFCGDCILRENVGKVARQLVWINLLNCTAREFNQSRKALNIGFSASDGDEIDTDPGLLSKLADFVVELCCSLLTASIVAESAETNVGLTISADDDLRAWGALGRHGN